MTAIGGGRQQAIIAFIQGSGTPPPNVTETEAFAVMPRSNAELTRSAFSSLPEVSQELNRLLETCVLLESTGKLNTIKDTKRQTSGLTEIRDICDSLRWLTNVRTSIPPGWSLLLNVMRKATSLPTAQQLAKDWMQTARYIIGNASEQLITSIAQKETKTATLLLSDAALKGPNITLVVPNDSTFNNVRYLLAAEHGIDTKEIVEVKDQELAKNYDSKKLKYIVDQRLPSSTARNFRLSHTPYGLNATFVIVYVHDPSANRFIGTYSLDRNSRISDLRKMIGFDLSENSFLISLSTEDGKEIPTQTLAAQYNGQVLIHTYVKEKKQDIFVVVNCDGQLIHHLLYTDSTIADLIAKIGVENIILETKEGKRVMPHEKAVSYHRQTLNCAESKVGKPLEAMVILKVVRLNDNNMMSTSIPASYTVADLRNMLASQINMPTSTIHILLKGTHIPAPDTSFVVNEVMQGDTAEYYVDT